MASIPDNVLQQFIDRQWTTLYLPGLQPLIDKAIRLFLVLIENPPNEPYNFDYLHARDPGDSGLNYRTGEQDSAGQKDRKIFFHYRPTLVTELQQKNPMFLYRHQELLNVCHKLRELCQEQQFSFMNRFDRHQGTKFCSLMSTPTDVLRLLAYTERRDDSTDILARAHFDQAAFTTALYESQPGLEFEDKSGVWVPISSEQDRPKFFTGGVAEQWGGLRATRHRVRQLDPKTRYNDRVIRFAVVYFGHLWKIKYQGNPAQARAT